MAEKKQAPSEGAAPDESWDTPAGRVVWLLRHKYGGSRSAMATGCKVSLTGIIKVVTGQQDPGRRLLTSIALNTDVNASWLLTGQGGPFTSSAVPVAHRALPGAPQEHPGLLTDEKVEDLGDLYSPSRYWLKVQPGEPVLRDKGRKIKVRDLLLVEMDRALFPKKEHLWERLCVVRVPATDPPVYKLAEVSYYEASIDSGPERLVADTFDLGPEVIKQTVIEESPDGEMRVYTQWARCVEGKRPRKFTRTVPVHPPDLDYDPLKIDYADVVGVCLLRVGEP